MHLAVKTYKPLWTPRSGLTDTCVHIGARNLRRFAAEDVATVIRPLLLPPGFQPVRTGLSGGAAPALPVGAKMLRIGDAPAMDAPPWTRLLPPPRRSAFGPWTPPVIGTPPIPQVDISGLKFKTLIRPDGRPVKIETWGEVVVPDLLLPGGVEMAPLVIDGPTARLQCFGDTGKGTAAQFEVAANLVAMGKERGVHATMHVGDIIYPSGILSPDDPRIDSLYIKPYGQLANPHAVFGNHEYGNGQAAGVCEAWLEAAKIGRPGMFAMPARYYSRRILVDGMTVRCLFIDSSTLAVDPLQLAWLKGELEKGADRTIVFGHHPVYSGGLHGTLNHMEKLLLPLLEKYADLYVCGHDHNLQFLHSDAGFPLIVTGGGGEARLAWKADSGHSEFFASTMGSTFLSINKGGIDVEICDGHTKKTLFTKHLEVKKRR